MYPTLLSHLIMEAYGRKDGASGMLILKQGDMTQRAGVNLIGGAFAGQSADTCLACQTMGPVRDPGCHNKLALTSYNQAAPFGPSLGYISSTFALAFTPGAAQFICARDRFVLLYI